MKTHGKRPIITTKKIRGELSQGLFLEMEQVGLSCCTPEDEKKWLQISDVTELLDVTKRPDPKDIIPVKPVKVDGSRTLKANCSRTLFGEVFVSGPPKTDELRVQSCMHLLDQLKGLPYYITLKIDGTSVTYGYDMNWDGLIVCSRNYMLSKEDRDDTVYGMVAKEYNMEEKLAKHRNLVIQGEIYGSNIQKNLLGQRGLKLAVFTIYNKERRGLLTYEELKQTCRELGLPMVPVEEVGQSFNYTMAELLEKAKGFYPKTKNHREGLVVRSQLLADTSKSHQMPISFKVINNDFLIAQDK